MTADELQKFLWFAAGLAALLGVVNLLRPAKRWLGIGGLLLSLTIALYALKLPTYVIAAFGCLGIFALGRDAAGRIGNKS